MLPKQLTRKIMLQQFCRRFGTDASKTAGNISSSFYLFLHVTPILTICRYKFARRPSYASNPVMSQMQPVPLYYPHPAAYSAPYAENDMFSQSSYNQAPYERIAYPSQFAPYQHPIYQTPLRMYDPTRDASSHRNTLTSSTESVHNPGSYTQDSETFLDEAGNLYRRYTPSEVTTAYLPMTPAQHLQHLQQQQQYYMPEYAQRRGMQPEKYEESSQAVQDHATNHRGPDEPTEENANWAVVQNEEQNGVLLVMDTTEGADGYGNIVERGPDGRRGDHMRYLNVVETEPNSYRYQPTGEPFNHTMHQTNTHPQLVQAPDNTSNHPIGFIKKQSATAMQRNHLAHLMTSPKTAPGGVKSPISPGGIPIVSKPSFWSRMFSRMKAVSVYSAILIAAWYVKDPKAVKAMAEKVQRRALAYAVVIFGGAREALEVAKRVAASRSANAFGGAQMSEGLNVKIVWEVVKRAFQRSLQDVIVYGGKALGVDVVVRPAVAAAALKK
ncbi:hypothetical protein BJ741DRAFT_619794 [Chytriomyces cf. hyalinus JEL632]|nr:hypothetical protein BJ741DRAFT_619794 [Chytriomyces cf. hyalinus JEL632]